MTANLEEALRPIVAKLVAEELAKQRAAPASAPVQADTKADLLDVDELAELTGISRVTLGQWRAAGKGPPWTKLGRAVRYRRAEVEAWIAANGRGRGPER